MANKWEMARIIKEEYTLTELEDRLEMKPSDLEDLEDYVEDHYDVVLEFLKEDLWLLDSF